MRQRLTGRKFWGIYPREMALKMGDRLRSILYVTVPPLSSMILAIFSINNDTKSTWSEGTLKHEENEWSQSKIGPTVEK